MIPKRPGTLFSNLRLGSLLLACLTLGGCTMLGKLGQVIWTPSIPVGGPDDQPSRYSLSLHASDHVNPRLISTGTAPDEDASRAPYTLNVQASSPQALTDKVQTLLNHLYQNLPAQSPLSVAPAPVVSMSPLEDALLGHYETQGVSLTTPWGNPTLQHVATPIAFKVLQLSDDSLLVNASVGYRRGPVELRLEAFNLLDSTDQDISYFYASRLPDEPAEGVEDIHSHPLEPRSVRVTVRLIW